MLAAYITFNGNTEDAFNFYKNALNGTIKDIQRFGDAPHGAEMPGVDMNKIMHIALEAPGGMHLMGNDYVDFSGEPFNPGNNFSLSLHPNSKVQADQYFAALSEGGSITVPMSTAPWGDYFGMFTDKFGIKWMINQQARP
jgi:PhnB protein